MESSTYENGTPCWVDLGTPGVAVAAAFYTGLFGWEIEISPAELGHYSMATLRGVPVAAIADQQAPGAVYWTTYLSTDDVDATVARAKARQRATGRRHDAHGRRSVAGRPTESLDGVLITIIGTYPARSRRCQ